MNRPLLLFALLLPLSAQAFDLQGHRGARGLMPENTLPAFAAALTTGVSTLELDVQMTRDGVLVVGHDPMLMPKLARGSDGQFLTTTGPYINTLTFEELRRFDVGRLNPADRTAQQFTRQQAVDGTRMPALSEVFALARKAGNSTVRFNIETKLNPAEPNSTPDPQTYARSLIDLIRREGLTSRTTIQSFDWRSLQIIQREAPEIGTVYLTVQQRWSDNIQVDKPGASPWTAGFDVDDHSGSVPRLVRAAGGRVWSPFYSDVTAAKVAEAKSLGLATIPWTVNDEAEMNRLIALGVDGIITDYPDVLRKVLAGRSIVVPVPTPVAP